MKQINYNLRNIEKTAREIKRKYPDAVILVSDESNYCAIEDDARLFSSLFGFTLIKSKSCYYCSFPANHLENVLHKAVKKNLRVAVCDRFA